MMKGLGVRLLSKWTSNHGGKGQFREQGREQGPGGSVLVSRGGSILASAEGLKMLPPQPTLFLTW